MHTNVKRSLVVATAFIAGAIVLAQSQLPDKGTATAEKPTERIDFESKLGSFKLIDGTGHVEFSFTGTVMLNGVEGPLKVSPGLRKEFDDMGRVAYFGTGSISLDGKFRGIQCFGKNLKGWWNGNGVGRLYGEFDENLKTGTYKFAKQSRAEFWSPYGTTFSLPPFQMGTADVNPVERKSGG